VTLYLQDADLTLYCGDALEVLHGLPDESVDCVVTSPPYWGLRNYGIEGQLGLEETPDIYVERMVEVFREVRRVLAKHGTCWVNLGDSYAHNTTEHPPNRGLAAAKEREDGNPRNAANWAVQNGSVRGGALRNLGALKPKDLCGIPWRVAFALQADGWWLRSEIIWSKPNPMPESVTDRPTKAHEQVFLLTKAPRYYFDQEAVREDYRPKTLTHRGGGKAAGKVGQQDAAGKVASGNFGDWDKPRTAFSPPRPQDETLDGSAGESERGPDGRRKTTVQGADGSIQHRDGERWPNSGRNIRTVWEIATQPFPEAHFATYPEELVRRCILAGCPTEVCRVCGKPRERVVERSVMVVCPAPKRQAWQESGDPHARTAIGGTVERPATSETTGWTDCGHGDYRPGIVLDPFMGSGTTALVARKHGRRSIGIDLSPDYCAMAAKRLAQLSLLTESGAA
jgi:DNA modification methylase